MDGDAVGAFRALVQFTDDAAGCRPDVNTALMRMQRTVKCIGAGNDEDKEYKLEQVGAMAVTSRLLTAGTVGMSWKLMKRE